MSQHNIGVVIPFYQRESGLLANALLSIGNQRVGKTNFTIVVVDDNSPIPADLELALVDLPNNCTVKVLKQVNSGPAVARNRGLDYLQDKHIKNVAFLDSDDTWSEDHISDALDALSSGAGFYFCDHTRFNSDYSWFESLDCFKNWESTVQAFNIEVNDNKKLATLSGENCFSLFIKDYLSQTSSIVYNFESQPSARFEPLLVKAGEDYFLWLQLINACEKVTFSLKKNIHVGEGVNIFSDSFNWSKLVSSSQQGYQFILCKMILKNFPLQKKDYDFIKKKGSFHLNLYSYLMIKHIITLGAFDRRLVTIMIKQHPLSVALAPLRFLKALIYKRSISRSR